MYLRSQQQGCVVHERTCAGGNTTSFEASTLETTRIRLHGLVLSRYRYVVHVYAFDATNDRYVWLSIEQHTEEPLLGAVPGVVRLFTTYPTLCLCMFGCFRLTPLVDVRPTWRPQPDNSTVSPVSHIEESHIQYISDVMLGTVNMTATNVTPWQDPTNPTFDPDFMGTR